MKNRNKKVVGLLLAGFGILFAANAIVAGPRAFGCGIAAVVGSILAGALWVACGAWMFLRSNAD
jgi:hypothetical protein